MSGVRRTEEIKHGHPGFPYHHVTTEDLTAKYGVVKLRRLPCGGCYEGTIKIPSDQIPIRHLNQPRTRLGAWFRRRFNR